MKLAVLCSFPSRYRIRCALEFLLGYMQTLMLTSHEQNSTNIRAKCNEPDFENAKMPCAMPCMPVRSVKSKDNY